MNAMIQRTLVECIKVKNLSADDLRHMLKLSDDTIFSMLCGGHDYSVSQILRIQQITGKAFLKSPR